MNISPINFARYNAQINGLKLIKANNSASKLSFRAENIEQNNIVVTRAKAEIKAANAKIQEVQDLAQRVQDESKQIFKDATAEVQEVLLKILEKPKEQNDVPKHKVKHSFTEYDENGEPTMEASYCAFNDRLNVINYKNRTFIQTRGGKIEFVFVGFKNITDFKKLYQFDVVNDMKTALTGYQEDVLCTDEMYRVGKDLKFNKYTEKIQTYEEGYQMSPLRNNAREITINFTRSGEAEEYAQDVIYVGFSNKYAKKLITFSNPVCRQKTTTYRENAVRSTNDIIAEHTIFVKN